MKKLVAALLAGVMVFSLAACGEKEEDFDAKGYVEGVLDATYHGDNDNFTVDVEITPVGLLDNLQTIFTNKLQEAVANGVDESGYMAVFNESVQESINQAQTYDPQTVTLNVTYEENSDGDHVYSINESDMEKLDSIATHMN